MSILGWSGATDSSGCRYGSTMGTRKGEVRFFRRYVCFLQQAGRAVGSDNAVVHRQMGTWTKKAELEMEVSWDGGDAGLVGFMELQRIDDSW